MNDPVILAASYLGPEGHGNDARGLEPWPAPLAEAFRRGNLSDLHWSLLFPSDPSRFARMDLMSRLGLMATELLEAGLDRLPPGRRERIGVCLETCAGSLATDVRFLRTPKPTLFTYTLPSTVLGEICIRYGLKGPMLCLVAADTSGSGALTEALEWVRQGEAEACLCLGCEVIDGEVSEMLPWPQELPGVGWHAGALLLGPPEGKPRASALAAGSLTEICRRRCAAAPSRDREGAVEFMRVEQFKKEPGAPHEPASGPMQNSVTPVTEFCMSWFMVPRRDSGIGEAPHEPGLGDIQTMSHLGQSVYGLVHGRSARFGNRGGFP